MGPSGIFILANPGIIMAWHQADPSPWFRTQMTQMISIKHKQYKHIIYATSAAWYVQIMDQQIISYIDTKQLESKGAGVFEAWFLSLRLVKFSMAIQA